MLLNHFSNSNKSFQILTEHLCTIIYVIFSNPNKETKELGERKKKKKRKGHGKEHRKAGLEMKY